jgi:hypothetical protein
MNCMVKKRAAQFRANRHIARSRSVEQPLQPPLTLRPRWKARDDGAIDHEPRAAQ